MDRCGSRVCLILSLALAAALTACVGKSSNTPGNRDIRSVVITPTGNLSLDIGDDTQTFTSTVTNGLGQTVTPTIRWVSSNNAALTISNTGVACAGSWDSLANPTVCTPGVTGVSQVTAIAGGVSSPVTTVYVHQHIDNISIAPIGTPNKCPRGQNCSCFSQGQTWQYQATAFSNGSDITNSVGPFAWSSSIASVLTTDTTLNGLQNNQAQITAAAPGVTQLFASISGVSSNPIPYTTCLVSYIRLQVQPSTGNSVSVAAGGSKQLVATAVDTFGNVVPKPGITWGTSDPFVATVSSTGGLTAKSFPGTASISASCTPPGCNVGVFPSLPIYASNGTLPNSLVPGYGTISVGVTASKPPVATAWTATTQCADALNCTSAMFSVAAGTTPISGTVELPRTPNSLQFVQDGSRVYVGSDQGLMFVTVGTTPSVSTVSSASSPCNVIVCGKILAVSSDGNRVVVSDTISQPNQVYIYDNTKATSPPVDLLIPDATAAAFSPDLLKLFIVSGTGGLYVYSTLDTIGSIPISANATDIAFSPDGSFVYVAGDPAASISGYSACSLPATPTVKIGNGPTSATPIKIFSSGNVLPNGPALITTDNEDPGDQPNPNLNQPSLVQNLIAVEPPNIELLTAQFTQDPSTSPSLFTCRPPIATDPTNNPPVPFITQGSLFNLGLGNFTPIYMQVVGDGSQVVLLAKNVGAVLIFNTSGGTTTTVPLVNNAVPLAASSTADGMQVFVAACEQFQDNNPNEACVTGTVHIVNPQNGGDIQQVPFVNAGTNNSMCTRQDPNAPPCVPDLITVKPQ